MNHIITTLFCLTVFALPAHAQEHERELTPGLNYTTMAKPKKAEMDKAEEAKETATDAGKPEKELDPATRVWNKYKDLATGKAAEDEIEKQKAEIDKPKKPEKPQVATPEEAAATGAEEEKQKSGLTAILDEWRNSKDSQKEMRSKSFKTPPLPDKDG